MSELREEACTVGSESRHLALLVVGEGADTQESKHANALENEDETAREHGGNLLTGRR
jgi:hypothetical protein